MRPAPQIGVRSSHTNRMARVPVVIVGGRHSRSHPSIAAATRPERQAGPCVSGKSAGGVRNVPSRLPGGFESRSSWLRVTILQVCCQRIPGGHRFHRPCPLAQTTARATMGRRRSAGAVSAPPLLLGDLRDLTRARARHLLCHQHGVLRKPAAYRTAIVLRGSRSRPEARLTLAATCSVAGCSV